MYNSAAIGICQLMATICKLQDARFYIAPRVAFIVVVAASYRYLRHRYLRHDLWPLRFISV